MTGSRPRRARFVARVLVLIALGVFVSVVQAQGDPPLTQEMTTLRDQLTSFTRLRVFAGTMARNNSGVLKMVVNLRSDETVIIDVTGLPDRISWDGTMLRRSYRGGEPKAWLAEAVPAVADLWATLRDPQATWTNQGPAAYGLRQLSGSEYAEVSLPYAWAEGWRLFLRFGHGGNRLTAIEVFSGQKLERLIGIYRVDINPSVPAMAFSPIAPLHPLVFPRIVGDRLCEGQECSVQDPPRAR